jgi:UDP-N-acetylglucosamine 2-epimerase (non-hydrolysing)
MPEEINRMVTDILAELLFTTSPEAETNLLREGVSGEKIHFVGNVMIDSLRFYAGAAESSTILEDFALKKKAYGLVTLHRPSNVDDPAVFRPIVKALAAIGAETPLLFPVHPRTRKVIESIGLEVPAERLRLLPPVGYLDFLKLMTYSSVVLTDSGGIQEETTALGVPCLTIRENTERPITIDAGTNVLVGMDRDKIVAEARRALVAGPGRHRIPDLWDGKAAARIVDVIESRF